jgi:hypothetical protein
MTKDQWPGVVKSAVDSGEVRRTIESVVNAASTAPPPASEQVLPQAQAPAHDPNARLNSIKRWFSTMSKAERDRILEEASRKMAGQLQTGGPRDPLQPDLGAGSGGWRIVGADTLSTDVGNEAETQ